MDLSDCKDWPWKKQLQQSKVCCHEGRSNRLKAVAGDSKCGRWTKEKCKKIQEKEVCCLKKDTIDKEVPKINHEHPLELATVYCDGFTSYFCDILEFIGIVNSTCCSVGHFDAVPLEDVKS